MDAKAKSLREILHSGDQFLVPFFQRSYSWHRTHWDRLRDDILSLVEDSGRRQHFLGPLVCAPINPVPGEIHGFQLIDGQQRLTTLSLVLTALRDVAKVTGEKDLAAEITETYLVHKWKKGLLRYKLVPRVGDREAFVAMIEEKPLDQYNTLGIVEAYKYFRKTIRLAVLNDTPRLRFLFDTVVGRLYLVVITIGEENPYEIFESLNSTGLPLQESDLIRNYLFMQLPSDEQAQFQSERWEAFEKLFDAVGNYPAVPATAFYREFLMRNGTYSRAGTTFVDFKNYHEQAKHSPYEAVTELTRFGKLALAVYRKGHGLNSDLGKALTEFDSLDASTANPLLLNLLDRYDRGELAGPDLADCMQDLASFVVRRSVCGESTRQYGRWFTEAIQHLAGDAKHNLRAYLLRRGWPDDETFQRDLLEFPIYRRESRKCKVILQALEEAYGHKEPVNLQSLQIEHVMPQTIPSGKAGIPWRTMLGGDVKRVHDRWLHTIGNLTLTGYNPNLSNKPFSDKRAELIESKLSLNKAFHDIHVWNEASIRARGEDLAQRVSRLWPRPAGGGYVAPNLITKPKAGRERRLAYWARLVELLQQRQSAWLPIKPAEGNVLELDLPAFDVSLLVQLIPNKQQVMVRLRFERARGQQMFDALSREKSVIDQEFAMPPTWAPSETPEVAVSLGKVSIRDQLDWLDQHEWLAERLAEYHRAFFHRLKELDEVVKEAKPHKQMLFEFWVAFHRALRHRQSFVRGVKPLPQNWNTFPIGRSHFWLEAVLNPSSKRIGVALAIGGPNAHEYWNLLASQKESIARELGEELEWYAPKGNKQCRIIVRRAATDSSDKGLWSDHHKWLIDQLERFHQVFHARVKALELPTLVE